MSEVDKKTEEIRALLRKKLQGQPPADDGWNVPSPGVWSGLSEELGTKTQPKSNYWTNRLASIIAALLVILCWRECSNQRQLTSLKSAVETADTAYGKLQAACEEKQTNAEKTLENLTSGIQNKAASEASAINNPAAQTDGQDIRFYPKSTNAKASNNKGLATKTIKNTTSSAVNLETTFTTFNPGLSQAASEGGFPKTAPPVLLPLLSISSFSVSESSPKANLHLPKPPHSSPAVKLVASGYGGLALTGNRLSGDKPAIIQGQKPLLAWRTGLGLEVSFSRRWSVLTGVDYNTSRIETDYQLAVPYRHSGETLHDDGNFDNQYNHSLPSPLGNYPAQFVLTRTSNAVVEESEVMNLELKIRQQTRFVSLPLQLRYGFGKHRWQAGAKAGILANHVIGVSSEMPKLVSLHGAIHERHTSIGAPALGDLQKWTLDYSLGLDLRFQLSPRFAISMSTAYQRGITPVYEDEAVKNHLHAWNLGAGVLYWLR